MRGGVWYSSVLLCTCAQKVAVAVAVGLRTALTVLQFVVTCRWGKNTRLTRAQAAFDVCVTPFLLAVAIVAQVVLLSKVRSAARGAIGRSAHR